MIYYPNEYQAGVYRSSGLLKMDDDDLDLPLYEIINIIGEKEGFDYPTWVEYNDLPEKDKNYWLELPMKFILENYTEGRVQFRKTPQNSQVVQLQLLTVNPTSTIQPL
jgi:hypothetical protein